LLKIIIYKICKHTFPTISPAMDSTEEIMLLESDNSHLTHKNNSLVKKNISLKVFASPILKDE
jgi:hypothetical protein